MNMHHLVHQHEKKYKKNKTVVVKTDQKKKEKKKFKNSRNWCFIVIQTKEVVYYIQYNFSRKNVDTQKKEVLFFFRIDIIGR